MPLCHPSPPGRPRHFDFPPRSSRSGWIGGFRSTVPTHAHFSRSRSWLPFSRKNSEGRTKKSITTRTVYLIEISFRTLGVYLPSCLANPTCHLRFLLSVYFLSRFVYTRLLLGIFSVNVLLVPDTIRQEHVCPRKVADIFLFHQCRCYTPLRREIDR